MVKLCLKFKSKINSTNEVNLSANVMLLKLNLEKC